MKRQVQLFIEGQRVDLFKDEQISINSTIQNLTDLSKTFTDFTQSFSVPASSNNNQIFKHFYNSDVSLVNGNYTNPSIRRFATLEIDNTFFRRGSVSLEKSNIENNEPYSYTITFYGDLVSLKDTFGETKFIELDWSSLAFDYSFNNVKERVENGAVDYDVRFPLISGSRYWQYNNPQTPDENIDTANGQILYTELFPAVKLSAILSVIETNFGITFQGGFLQDDKFLKAFMLFKSTIATAFITPPKPIEFSTITPNSGTPNLAPPFPYVFDYGTNAVNGATAIFDDTNNTIQLEYVQYEYEPQQGQGNFQIIDTGNHVIEGIFTNLNVDAVIYVDVYLSIPGTNQESFNGTIEVSNAFPNNQSINLWVEANGNNPNINTRVRFETRTSIPASFNIELQYRFTTINSGALGGIRRVFTTSISTVGQLDLTTQAPDLTVQQFISDLLSLYNLTVYGVKQNVYEIQTVEEWYNEGQIWNITEYTDTKKIDVARIKLFNNINFKYEQSSSITNRQFASIFLREYGDLSESFNYDGGDFNIEVGFENILFSKFDNVPLQVGYCLDENLAGYVPKPIIIYENGEQNANFYLGDGTATPTQLTNYMLFGQDVTVINEDFSLNFGTENSSFTLTPNQGGLYNTYYKAYIQNLYNPKNREYTAMAVLPLSILTQFKLNDRFVIRDRRYIPNNVKINLTTGEATLTLTNDFRQMIADQVPPIVPPITPSPDAQCFNQYIPFVNGAVQVDLTQCGTIVPGVTINPTTLTEPGVVEICIPENEGAENYLVTETFPVEPLATENNDLIMLESSTSTAQIITICLTYTLANGNQVANQIFIQRP